MKVIDNNINANSKLKKNVFFNILYQLFQIVIPIILIPILSGRLETGGNGSYAYIHSIVLYFSYFALLGVNYFGTKTIANKKANGKGEEKKYFWIIFFAKVCTSFVAILGYLLFCFIYSQNTVVLYTQIFFLIGNLLDVSWFFMGDENFKNLAIRNVFVKTVSLVLIVLFVKDQSDIGIYSLILGLAEVLNQVFMWAMLIRRKIFKKENFEGIKFKNIIESLKGMAIYFVPQLLIELYTILNTTFLGVAWGSSTTGYSEVGIFDYANKIVSVLTTIAVSLGMVFLARVSSLKEQGMKEEIKEKIQMSMYFSLFISLPLVIGIIGTGHSFVNWFLDGDDWSKVGTILFFLPLKVIFVAISNTLGVQYMISTGKLKRYILSVASGAVICIVLNFILVKPYGAIGSAISVVVAELCVTIVQIVLVRKEIDVLFVFKRLWKPLVACLAMGVYLVIVYIFGYHHICMFFSSFSRSTRGVLIMTDLLIAFIGALIYFGVLIMLNEQTVNKVISKIKFLKNRRIFVGVATLITAFTLVCSTTLYTSYSIRFDHHFAARKRTYAAALERDSRMVTFSDDLDENGVKPFVTILPEAVEEITEKFDKKQKGILYHYSPDINCIDMITINFYFFQCADYGTSYEVCLKYALEENEIILNNIDNLCLCIDVYNNAKDSKNEKYYVTNEDGTFTNYFKNKKRDFLSVNGSTSIWYKEDFKAEKNGELIYKDNCYCTISMFFVADTIYPVAASLNEFNPRQEVWILNGK